MKEKLLAEGIPKYLALPSKSNSSSNNNSGNKGGNNSGNHSNNNSMKHTTANTQPAYSTKPHPAYSTKPHPPTGAMESVAHGPSHLNITSNVGKRQEQDNAQRRPTKALLPAQCLKEAENNELRRSPRILAKRVRSVVDEVRIS